MSVSKGRVAGLGGVVGGYAPLDSGLLVPRAYLPGRSAKLDNMTATAAPAVGNDNTQGYGVGSMWFDTTNRAAYVCVDAATGAAVWRKIMRQFGLLTNTTAAGATWLIPDASVPREGSGIFTSDGTDGAGIIQWYRLGSFNRIEGVFTSNTQISTRSTSLSPGGAGFSIYIEGNNVGDRIGVKNNAAYPRNLSLLVIGGDSGLAWSGSMT